MRKKIITIAVDEGILRELDDFVNRLQISGNNISRSKVVNDGVKVWVRNGKQK